MSDIAIKVEGLGKKYLLRHQQQGRSRYKSLRDVLTDKARSLLRLGQRNGQANGTREEFWALKNVSFEIKQGEAVGIIGRNGAGKSTLLKLLSRITEPTTGRIEVEGRVASLLEVGTGFHPELTGRENIFLNGAILGMSGAEIRKKFDEIVAFAEVEKFLDTPVKRYSSGMYMRLAFAVAAHLEPEILIVDEVLSVGDAEFQKKCLGRMQNVAQDEGRTVLFVSHNLQAIRQLCERVVLLKQGQVAFVGEPHLGIDGYLNQSAEDHSATLDLTSYPRARPPEGARLLSLRFLDEQGRPASWIALPGSLVVEVRFRADQPLKRLDVPMAVTHMEGLRVFSETYADQHGKLNLEPGEYLLRFSVPLRFFKLESYFLGIGLFEDGRQGDFVDGLPLPEFVNQNADPHTESQRWGVVRIPVEWSEVQPVRPALATQTSL
jgi:lipopolysaccharide transport system ATP-binding protein